MELQQGKLSKVEKIAKRKVDQELSKLFLTQSINIKHQILTC